MTKPIFSTDAYTKEFQATVRMCTPHNTKYHVLLDHTAFFPEQGGQYADTGTLDDIQVLDVQICDDEIIHITEKPLTIGQTVIGRINWEKRFDHMQNHTGEHILSGLIHTQYGLDNVGFHLSDDDMTLDTNGPLSREQLDNVEDMANTVIFQNLPVQVSFPAPDVLAAMEYRAKLDIVENVRIITIPGVDACACCAPHVRSTGEIGCIRILDAFRYKGGMRIHAACGRRALLHARSQFKSIVAIANELHIQQQTCVDGVLRLLSQISAQKAEIHALQKTVIAARAAAIPCTAGNLCLIEANTDPQSLRMLVYAAMEKCGGICGAFSGNDTDGYQFVIGSKTIPLQQRAKEITAALLGRGGGNDQCISGTVSADENTIRNYIEQFEK